MKNCKKALSILLCLLMLVSLLPGSVLALESAEAEPEAALEEAAEVSAEETELPAEEAEEEDELSAEEEPAEEAAAEPEAAPEEALVEDEPTQAPEYLGKENVAWMAIDSDHFPDVNFRSFVSKNYNTDSDNGLSAAEIAAITKIDCSSKSIASLQGIEYFTSLTKLYCYNNQLTSLDVSGNTLLVELACESNQLTLLDVSKNINLVNLTCFDNRLSVLDISATKVCNEGTDTRLGQQYNNRTIKVTMTEAQKAAFEESYAKYDANSLVTIDLVPSVEINSTNFPDTIFREFVSTNYDSNGDGLLVPIEIKAVKRIYCEGMSISSLKGIEYFTALTSLDCRNNQLTQLDISKNSLLTELVCYNNQLSSLDIYNTEILSGDKIAHFGYQKDGLTIRVRMTPEQLDVYNARWARDICNDGVNVQLVSAVTINSIDFPDDNFRELISIDLDTDGDKILSFDELAAVTQLYLYNKNIASLKGIECFFNLDYLYCCSNYLTNLDVSKNLDLTQLICSDNQLTSLDLSANTALTTLYCGGNQLTGLDLSANTALTRLYCGGNRLLELDLSANTALTYVSCSDQTYTVSSDEFTKSGSSYSISINGVSKQFSTIPQSFTIELPLTGYSGSLEVIVSVQTSIPIDDDHFPDELFALYLMETADTNNDNVLSAEEIFNLHTLDLSKAEDIESLQGIKYLLYLWELDCSGNKLTSLDLSSNRRLTTLNCSNNQLTALDLSNLRSLQQVDCSGNQLTWLGLYQDTFLLKLNCRENLLTSLDVSSCKRLENLNCRGNTLTSLDVSSCANLNELDCDSNWLESLDVSANTALGGLYTGNNDLTSLTLGSKPSLMILDCQTNYLDSLDLSGLTGLCALRCDCNCLSSLDVSACSLLEELQCDSQIVFISSDQVTKTASGYSVTVGGVTKNFTELPEHFTVMVPVTGFDAEMDVYCEVNTSSFTEPAIDGINFPDANFRSYVSSNFDKDSDGKLNKEELAAITKITFYDSSIASLKGIEYFTALTALNCSNAQLTSLDVSKNTALEGLSCYGNQLTSLDVSKNTALRMLFCGGNQLTSLDVSKNTELTTLHCYNNQLTSLNVSGCAALTELNCSSNQLTSLDVSKNTALTELSCPGNQLTSLDVSKNSALIELFCYSNQLTSLDVSKNTALAVLNCAANRLTSLDVSKNTALIVLNCAANRLTYIDISGTKLSDNFWWADPDDDGYIISFGSQQNDKTITVIMTEAQLALYNKQIAATEVRVTTLISGDVNSDGHATLADVSLLYKYLTGKAKASALNRTPADLTMDGKLTLRDVSALFSRCAK